MKLRLAARVPEPIVEAWNDRRKGPVLKVLSVVIAMPIVVNVLYAYNPPLGVYLNGLVIGCLYALLAMGLILVYRANRIINFAQATMGIVPVVLAITLIESKGLNYWPGLLLVLAGSAILGAGFEHGTIRLFDKAPRLFVTIATIGIAQGFAFFELLIPILLSEPGKNASPYGATPVGYQGQIKTPFSGASVEIGGVFFTGDHLMALIVVALVAAGLVAFFRFTDVGIAVRAAAENQDRAKLAGIPIRRVSTLVWIIAGVMSGVGIFLRAPLVGMPVGGILLGPGILLYALAAAVIARMESLPVALIAGLGIGVLDQATFYGTRNATISNAIMLPVILIALLVQRRSIARAHQGEASSWQSVKEFHPIPVVLRNLREVVIVRASLWALGAGLLVSLPFIVGPPKRASAILLLIYSLVGVSLVILTGWAGQISLGQWALSGVGAAVAGGLAANHSTDFFFTILAAGLAGTLFSVAIGIPALRIPGLFLAVTTLAFAANMQFFFLNRDYFGWILPESTIPVFRPILYGTIDVTSDLGFYYLVLVILGLATMSARAMRSSRSGRVLIASRDNPSAAQAYGVNLTRTRLAAFAISGFFAAIAGALFAYLNGAVDPPGFTATASAELFTMAVIGGLTSLAGPVLGAGYLVTFRNFLPNWHDIHLVAQGAGIFLILRFANGGLAEVGYRIRDAFLRRVAAKHGIDVPSLGGTAAEAEVQVEAAFPVGGFAMPGIASPNGKAHSETITPS